MINKKQYWEYERIDNSINPNNLNSIERGIREKSIKKFLGEKR